MSGIPAHTFISALAKLNIKVDENVTSRRRQLSDDGPAGHETLSKVLVDSSIHSPRCGYTFAFSRGYC